MVVVTQLTAVVAALSTTAAALPMAVTRNFNSPKAFSVNQVSKQLDKTRVINLPAQYAHALSKYGAQVPEHIKSAAEQGSAVTTPEQHDQAYLTPVRVGTSTLHLDIDTGSADLWVFSDELPPPEQAGHSLYRPSNNATQLNGYSWKIQYGDGSSAGGNVYKDVVAVGGVTAQRQAVEAAKHVSQQFIQDTANDGIMGLGFSSANQVHPQPQLTFFDTVKSQLDRRVFAASLKHNAPGSYDFGFIDNSKYTGSLEYTPVDSSKGFWMFTADGYGVGSSQPTSTPIQGIADTGTSLLLLPDSVVQDYYRQVSGAVDTPSIGGFTFPCTTSLPEFTVQIGSYKAVVPSEYIKYAPIRPGSSTCFGGIQTNGGLPFSILGDIFLKSQYVVFDSMGPQLGFAPQA